jgi:hypothetical protein
MNKLLPFFEVDGVRYEIKPTRWLLAEYEKLQEQSEATAEDKEGAIKTQSLVGDVKRYATLMQELWEEYTQNFDDEVERRYLKVKALYEISLEKLTAFEVESGCTKRIQKMGIDLLEKVAILGLAEQYFNMNQKCAEEVWVKFVETLGKSNVPDWLGAMAECLFNDEEEEENPFLAQVRARAEEKANNRKNGLRKVK